MNEINIYLTDLVSEGRLTHPEAESFMDWAYDMELNDEDNKVIKDEITKSVEEYLVKKSQHLFFDEA